ncbi:hypothetical protein CSV86_014775 [Pseudomonas putida CSV86]|uniref:Uncharacterized protein n=1 Tax=Pseudomonas bharatica CSV86 TaxID=1005395 RepID=L1M537_9PSED|nr:MULTISPECIES: hypothetical protein [Pseudomonas]MDG9886322.1 hypothetical protein [Pseudomonas sp. GD04058]NNJ16390.1 hypothetical protein [Pseudomonas bharatica CSV86]
MMRFFKPMRGCRIFASEKHMTRPAGEFIGWCEKVEENICIFRDGAVVDRFIWRFNNSNGTQELNSWYEYSA